MQFLVSYQGFSLVHPQYTHVLLRGGGVGWLVVFYFCLSRVGCWSLSIFVPSVVVALNGNWCVMMGGGGEQYTAP